LDKGLAIIALGMGLGFGGLLAIAAYFLSKPIGGSSPAPTRLVLSKPEGSVVLSNLERVRTIRDDEGRLVELEIHREIRR